MGAEGEKRKEEGGGIIFSLRGFSFLLLVLPLWCDPLLLPQTRCLWLCGEASRSWECFSSLVSVTGNYTVCLLRGPRSGCHSADETIQNQSDLQGFSRTLLS